MNERLLFIFYTYSWMLYLAQGLLLLFLFTKIRTKFIDPLIKPTFIYFILMSFVVVGMPYLLLLQRLDLKLDLEITQAAVTTIYMLYMVYLITKNGG